MILLAGLAGGVVGFLLGTTQSPLYEATAAIRLDIDRSRSLPLDDAAERQALNRALDLILSDETLGRALEQMPEFDVEGDSSGSISEFRQRIRVRDLRGRWELVASSGDPQTAAAMSNSWALAALETAQDSLVHAWRAAELQGEVFGLGCELVESPDGSEAALWNCERASSDEQALELVDSLLLEAQLSNGLLPSLSASLLESALVPSDNANQFDAMYALAGTVAGLILGSLFVTLRSTPAQAVGGNRAE